MSSGYVLTQHINTHGAAFPVTADPHYTWGWVTGTIYFNKQETAILSSAAGGAAFLAAYVPVWGTALAGYSVALSTTAGIANAHHKCLEIKLPSLVPHQYSGGYCR
jgi:hypothetical protein